MFMSIVTDTASKRSSFGEDCRYCEECKTTCAANSWHCVRCNACVLRRDHHCFAFNKCIGLHNHRYFILYTFHVAICMVYCFYFTAYYIYIFLCQQFHLIQAGCMEIVYNCIFPWFKLLHLVNETYTPEDLFIITIDLMMLLNVQVFIFCLYVLGLQIKSILMGMTLHESNKVKNLRIPSNWRKNVKGVLGTRWYLTVFWPFVSSPLPIHTF
ncbi:hypothetical protein O0L34_g13193 [Tuta absoluta]|nr:hypothetical protein O0L34_g13193 [Tuta absoluta]